MNNLLSDGTTVAGLHKPVNPEEGWDSVLVRACHGELNSLPPFFRVFCGYLMDISMFNWRLMIIRYSRLQANAKYIAIYLSTYMNEWGDNCFPSIERIVSETGLSKPTVCKYLGELRDADWLESRKKGFDGQGWAHNQYYPNIPKKAVKELNQLQEGGKTESKRRLNSGEKAVKLFDHYLSKDLTNNSPRGNNHKLSKRPSTGSWGEWESWGKKNGIKAKPGEDMGSYVARLKGI